MLLVAAGLPIACGKQAGSTSDAAGAAHEGAGSGWAPEALSAPHVRPRALWVLAEGSQRVLEDEQKVRSLVRDARALGSSDLFVQVYRGGRAWYDASLADSGPFRSARERSGRDLFAELIERAHAAGVRVHAWVNVLSLSRNRDAPLLVELGKQAVLVDRRGRSLLDYPSFEVPEPDVGWYRMGTRGLYLDPAAPGVRERLVAIFAELVGRYPQLDGLHLDYVRHPGVLPFVPGSRFGVGLDFGYGEASLRRFRAETGSRGPYANLRQPGTGPILDADRWDSWRRDQVSELVAAISAAARAAQPDILVSAAVIGYVDRAYLSLAQDWHRWLQEGSIDLAVPMTYTRDDRLLRYQLERFATDAQAERIWAGIGVWLFAREPARALRQLEIAHAAGVVGEALFSYDSISESAALRRALESASTSTRP